MTWLKPVTLEDDSVALVPLSHDHHDPLVEAVQDGELWNLWYTLIPKPEGMTAEIDRRLGLQDKGSMLPFTVLDKTQNGKPVGMTTYMNVDAANRRVEIGSTWYRKSVQRSPLNTRCKILLLSYAFETLDCIAVEFRTHFFNHQSREAIARLGAKQDGILRNHQLGANGSMRDTVVFSILPNEWPAVKTHLQHRLDRLAKGQTA
ncbi:GNAT family protein [Ferrovibrio sp.]|uniref:GNAT family N-acetyltransferase n=1 Tax=Ferrovibrio sp. TaxID=1917215 RepID=UPI000CA72585|nr:GNAT family protein [Ferrovibrio sp.]PJI42065.1 MAG: N-acetyltransferase [Ferrovibrio sp.]